MIPGLAFLLIAAAAADSLSVKNPRPAPKAKRVISLHIVAARPL